MYYAKYIKYKNKYLNLKYQLGGTLDKVLKINKKKIINTIIPDVSTTLEPIAKTTNFLKNSLIGLKVLDSDSTVLVPFVAYNKKFKKNPIYFYRYIDKSGNYILCSLYRNNIIFKELQKKNVRIQKISIDEYGNISLSIKNISILEESKKLDLEAVKNKLLDDLVGIKILQTNSSLLIPLITDKEFKEFNKKNKIYYYTYTDKDGKVYILCSLYDYYEFLDILYEHIEIKEVNIDDKGVITQLLTTKIYHIIPKPDSGVYNKTITLPIKKTKILHPSDLIGALSCNSFIIIDKQDDTSEILLNEVCMYNLFIGTIHVYVIYMNDKPTEYFLLSLFTEYELNQKCIYKPPNIELYECRLYKQGDRIEFILYKDMVTMMFCIYIVIRESGYHGVRYYRGNPAIDNQFLDVLDPNLLEKCRECISIEDIAFNTSLFLHKSNIQAKNHKDILEMKKDFLENNFELINSNEKIQSWRYNFENLKQLWEYSLKDLEVEVEKFKKELLGLEPCHRELLVLKLNEKGFAGRNMEEILDFNVLCYLDEDEEDKNKRLVYENTEQIDPNRKFVKNTPYIPEMKKLLEKEDSCEDIELELHKYRQTVIMFLKNNENQIMYTNNQRYFFAFSWYDHKFNLNYDKTFDPLEWSIKFNKLAFQCLALKDNIIFPLRIINIEYLESPLTFSFNIKKLKFCGYFHTRFTDNYNGINDFNMVCRDKFYFIYHYSVHEGNKSGKDYRLFYYTGNNIWFEISILPYYKIILCEINWIYYTLILKYETIPHFYEYINDYCEKEIVVSIFSLDEIRCKYEENSYNTSELAELKEVFYNHNYYRRINITDTIFLEKSLFSTKVEQDKFVKDTFLRKKL
jgi:hypothetical protein